MKISSLQKVDRWVGIPLCFLLTVLRRIFGRKEISGVQSARKILLVKLAEQGSTVLAYNAIRRATEIAGRENVHFIAFDENRFILDALGLIPEENVITISFKNGGALVASTIHALRKIRELKFDAAIDLEFFARGSAAITFLSGAKTRIGFHSYFGAGPYRGDLMTHRLLYNPYLHTSQIFRTMIDALQQSPETLPNFSNPPPIIDDELPRFPAKPEEIEFVRNLLQREIRQTVLPPIILLNPNASDLLPLRRWESSRYVELAKQLLERFPEIFIGLTGGEKETEAIEKIARAIDSPRCISFAGKTTLRELLILYSFAEILVTNDSGPAHFAALTPIDVVTLFGPETPRLFAAKTPRNTPLWAGIVCSPCVNAYNNRQTSCTNNLCMKLITVEQVLAEVSCIYEKRRSGRRISNGF